MLSRTILEIWINIWVNSTLCKWSILQLVPDLSEMYKGNQFDSLYTNDLLSIIELHDIKTAFGDHQLIMISLVHI